jgi:hypothetical protein
MCCSTASNRQQHQVNMQCVTHAASVCRWSQCMKKLNYLECVAAVAVHVPTAIWCASVTEQHCCLVHRLWPQAQKVPEHAVSVCAVYSSSATAIST